jgi:hypothetical protein
MIGSPYGIAITSDARDTMAFNFDLTDPEVVYEQTSVFKRGYPQMYSLQAVLRFAGTSERGGTKEF